MLTRRIARYFLFITGILLLFGPALLSQAQIEEPAQRVTIEQACHSSLDRPQCYKLLSSKNLDSHGFQKHLTIAESQQNARPEDFAAEDGLVLWTLANSSWLDFVLNWIASVRSAGVKHFFVACLDEGLVQTLQALGLPCVNMNVTADGINMGEELTWGNKKFKQRGIQKITFIESMLQRGLSPIFSDLDVAWTQDPIPYMRQHPEADILISMDLLWPNVYNGSLERCPSAMKDSEMGLMNVGIHIMRPGALPVIKSWRDSMIHFGQMEQTSFNMVVQQGFKNAGTEGSPSDLCRGLNDEVLIGLLPPALFANGHLFFVQGLQKWQENQFPGVMAAHTNFNSGRSEKQYWLRDWKLWKVDDQERFRPKGGFMTFEFDVPWEMVELAAPPRNIGQRKLTEEEAKPHFALLEHQLKQVKAAVQIALALKRELIIPRFWCGFYNGYWGVSGNYGPYELPYQCQTSHIFNLYAWSENVEKGLLPPLHEHSILEHKAMQDLAWLHISSKSLEEKDQDWDHQYNAEKVSQSLERCQTFNSGSYCEIDETPEITAHFLEQQPVQDRISQYQVVSFKKLSGVQQRQELPEFAIDESVLKEWWCSTATTAVKPAF